MNTSNAYNAGDGRVLLSHADKDWQLANKDQNIIGWKVLDTKGQRIGVVADMIVDTIAGYVDAVLLDTGTALSTNDINIGDGVVIYEQRMPLNDVTNGSSTFTIPTSRRVS
ncbi:MAG TPA: PRC-barrel domain-containing protein [Candidatus Kapabacteria bacterium]|nr:PRC-barrel domain-containing protein [Candidatus Kapabacteria bacterium]